jgi:uncharacterized protein YcbX
MRIASLYRYPVKGLSPERLNRATLKAGDYFPGDRLFAVENGPSGFDPAAPAHQPKIKYLMLMKHESLARLKTRYEDATGELVIQEGGREVARGDLSTPAGRVAVEAFFRRYLPGELRGPPKVLAAPQAHRFTDSPSGYVSLINLASARRSRTWSARPSIPYAFAATCTSTGSSPGPSSTFSARC